MPDLQHFSLHPAARMACVIMGFSLLTSCDNVTEKSQNTLVIEGKTMGTFYRVSLAGVDNSREAALRQQIEAQLVEDDHELSTYKDNSVLSRFNQYQGNLPQPISAGMADAIVTALRIGVKTAGAMDITVGPLVNLWGFGPDKQPVKSPDRPQIEAARLRVGLRHIRLSEDIQGHWLQKDLQSLYVDLSTLGEGYATDHVARLLEKKGINRYLVSVGGAVITRGLSAVGQ